MGRGGSTLLWAPDETGVLRLAAMVRWERIRGTGLEEVNGVIAMVANYNGGELLWPLKVIGSSRTGN